MVLVHGVLNIDIDAASASATLPGVGTRSDDAGSLAQLILILFT